MDTTSNNESGNPDCSPLSLRDIPSRTAPARRSASGSTKPRKKSPRKPVLTGQADLCVFIGRFEPEHIGHDTVIREGLSRAQRMLVLVGSANEPRSRRNPFYADERIGMLLESFQNDPRLSAMPLENSTYNLTDWIERVHLIVQQVWADFRRADPSLTENPVIALIGHAKDATSYYLDLFPEWASIEVPQTYIWSATDIRADLFGGACPEVPDLLKRMEASRDDHTPGGTQRYLVEYTEMARTWARSRLNAYRRLAEESEAPLSTPVLDFLTGFLDHPDYPIVAQEFAFVAKYRFDWRHAPYTPVFITGDVVVVQSGYVLMVRREKHPGKGLLAIPGGFIEPNEPIYDGAVRELIEETSIDIREKVLRKNLVAHEMFDDPFRSSRGRTVTNAYLIHLDPGPLPKIAPQHGEATDVLWVLLADLKRSECFEDHYSIIKRLTAQI